MISSQPYGTLASGETVTVFTLAGRGSLLLEVITYGGAVTRLLAPDREGKLDDVVLGYDDLDHYLRGRLYFGAITGRVAGRIPNASFTLNGKTYNLARNDLPHHLHGGLAGFDKKLWTATPSNRADGAPSLRLTYLSADGEEGYPGNVQAAVTYTVLDDNIFLIESEASTDQTTPFSLTHHSYFNLAGHGAGSIADHFIEIFASEYVPVGEDLILCGRLESVEGRGNDLRAARRFGDIIPSLAQRHGDLYAVPSGSKHELAPAARVQHAASGRVLSVSTTEPFLQLYTGSHLEGPVSGKRGACSSRHGGFCLECEGYPDPSIVSMRSLLHPGAAQFRATAYAFSASESLPANLRQHGAYANIQERAN
ncbi:MAG TPA: aldose epimerase family protein [Terracidiphilus sp.]